MANLDLTSYEDSGENKKGQDISVNFSQEEKALIQQYKDKINLTSTTDVIQFGVGSQTKVSNFSNEILKQVRTKEMVVQKKSWSICARILNPLMKI